MAACLSNMPDSRPTRQRESRGITNGRDNLPKCIVWNNGDLCDVDVTSGRAV